MITGVTGFLGSHVLKACVAENRWRVRGTVRDLSNTSQLQQLKAAVGDKMEDVELVHADLLDAVSVHNALESAKLVIHTAAPMPIEFPARFEDVSKATVEGTIAVLNACKAHSVSKLILTSHYGAINHVDELDRPDEFDETIWSDESVPNFQHVHRSKLLAEKAAWDFVKDGAPFTLITLVPTLLVGPSLLPRPNTSSAFLSRMIRNQLPGMYRIQWGLVDVRDAANAHVKALDCSENQRVIVSAKSMWCREIGICLAEEFGNRYRFSTEEAKFCMMRFLGTFFRGEDAEMAAYKPIWGKSQEYSN